MVRAAQVVTPETAQAERAKRELARRSLLGFGAYMYDWWRVEKHLRLVASGLERVVQYIETQGAEGCGRLIVEMPPRHGKTVLTSQLCPSWLMGRMPDSRVILTSYGADLAQENSRKAREIVSSPRFAAVFGRKSVLDQPVEMSDDSRAKSNWDLAAPHRGGCVSAGVGGGITGKGAHLLVVDDPFKNREEAESEARREAVMSWYASSAYTRLEEGGAIVIIHTRWHLDDLIGRLLTAMASSGLADQWEVINLPALAFADEDYAQSDQEQYEALLEGLWRDKSDSLGRQPGEALWPQKYPAERLYQVRSNLEATGRLMDWYSLYQQSPRPMEGAFFGEQDFRIVDKAPDGLQWVRYDDLALSEKRTADYNASVAEAMDADGTLYLRDMIRVRGWDAFRERIIAAMVSPLELGTVWGIEDVAFQALAFRELMRDKRLANVAILPVKPEGDKVTRARPFQTRAKAGKVCLVRGAWNRDFINECLEFPGGKHDDQVDTASGGLQMIAGEMVTWLVTHD